MDIYTKKIFASLILSLEPECLFQDGERSRAEAKKAELEIHKAWKKEEKVFGRKVTQDEAWSFI